MIVESGPRVRVRHPLALAGLVSGVLVAVAGSALAAPAATVGPGSTPNPASRLSLLRTGEAGIQTQPLPAGQTNGVPFQTDTTIEPSLAVNPANPAEIATGFQSGRDDAGGGIDNGFATSHDGGRTWTRGAMPGLTATSPSPATRYTRASDAVLTWGLGERVYYSSLVFDPSGLNLVSAIVNSTSTDGGLTWGLPTIVQDDDGAGLNDKNWTVVDRSAAAGHHLGRVYVVWDRVAGIFAKYSDDGGVTWVPPSPIFGSPAFQGQGIGSLPVVLPSGALSVIFESQTMPIPGATATPGEDLSEAETGLTKFSSVTATAAGTQPSGTPLVFGPATTITTYRGTAVRGQRAAGLLDAEVDPVSGRIYTVFESAAARTDSNNDVVISHSDDSGVTWSAPARVNGGPGGDQVDHYDPSVAIGPGSTVRVMWRQRQENASSNALTFSPYVSTWIAQSTDGTTFLPALQVDRGTNDVRYGAFSRGGTFQGDYDELVTVGDTSFLVYCDSYPANDGETPPATPSATTVHHQRTIVSIVTPLADAVPPALPESPHPALGLLALLGAAGVLAVPLTRRRRRQVAAMPPAPVVDADQRPASTRRHRARDAAAVLPSVISVRA